ncbi:MAG: ornithine cyclodeaminase family protein, partial [Acidimicrobiales bacterium]
PTDDFLMMPAVSPAGIGVKIVNVVSGNRERGLPLIHGFYLYCDRETGIPTATLDGSALTTLRTPAASALAADLLARPDAATLGVFGTGVQARGHLEAMLVVRPGLDRIVVSGRTPESSVDFVTDPKVVGLAGGRALVAAGSEETAGCDIVCGCTSSTTPVIPTHAVRPGAHVGLVGSYSMARREVDADLVNLASVFVDDRHAAAAEAGDLMAPAEDGEWSFDAVVGDLAELCSGRVGRTSDDEITLFKSVGLAAWDLIVASAVVKAG